MFSLEVGLVVAGVAGVEDMFGGRRRDGGGEAPELSDVVSQKGNPPVPRSWLRDGSLSTSP